MKPETMEKNNVSLEKIKTTWGQTNQQNVKPAAAVLIFCAF